MTADSLFDAIVVGAGPAGATAALGLAGLGYRVRLISSQRAPAVEGLSARAVAGLERVGLSAECASAMSSRRVSWAGEISARGQERIVRREQLDAELLTAISKVGIPFTAATVSNIRRPDAGRHTERESRFDVVACGGESKRASSVPQEYGVWRVDTGAGHFFARTILDARGRRARRSDVRGPRLVAWNQLLRSASGPDSSRPPGGELTASSVVALQDGWCWLARTGNTTSLQFVGSANDSLSAEEVSCRFEHAATSLGGDFPRDGWRGSRWIVRAAVARYSRPCRSTGYIRIGDAAVAMDPLSGNGVHEAVRSATAAVAAVNSYLQGVSWEIVARFIDERALELWRRSVSAAGHFYRLQANHAGDAFWMSTAAEYERLAHEATIQHEGAARFEERPVLDGNRIDLRQVWVSAEWPRGVWKVDGQSLEQVPAERVPAILRRAAGGLSREVSDDR